MNTRIVRLQDGSEIIANVTEIMEGQYVLENPMEFDIQHSRSGVMHIILQHFLPHKLVEKNEVMLDKKDIVFITMPSPDFSEYYLTQVESIKEQEKDLSKYEEELQEDMNEKSRQIIMEAFAMLEPEEKVLH
jgi:hypothetical protein